MADFSLLLEKEPPGWNDFRLGDICTRVQGNYQPDPNGTRLYLGLEHLAQGLPMLVGRGSEADVKSSKYAFQPNDILFGKLRPYLRKCVLMREEGVCSTDILVFRANDKVVPQYLCYLCHTDQFIGYAKATTSGVQHPRTSWNSLGEFRLTLPPFDEQRRIARVLSTVQTAIEQQARLIALTRELKSALMRKLFAEGLRGEKQKETEIGLVPESWEVVELGSLAKIGNGSTPKRDNKGYWDGGSIPWLTSGKIHERFIEQADEFVTDLAVKECHLPSVRANSLLIAITGQGKTLGNSALIKFETCISQHLAYVQFHSEEIVPEFLLWFLQTRYHHLRSVSQAGGSTKGALTCGYIKTYPVPVPAKDEQREIASIFAVLDEKERTHARKKALLEELFRSLLHQLMTAQIRVNGDVVDLTGLKDL